MSKRLKTNYIVVHCSATKPDMDIGVDTLRMWHKANGWSDVGYHYIIKRDGEIQNGRPADQIGAHVKDYNAVSIGICLIGGIDNDGKAADNFTGKQKTVLRNLLRILRADYPKAFITGHRDLSPDLNRDGKITSNEWVKECPCFDVADFLIREKV